MLDVKKSACWALPYQISNDELNSPIVRNKISLQTKRKAKAKDMLNRGNVLLDSDLGRAEYFPRFITPSCFEVLDTSIAWQQDVFKIYGREVPFPRLTAWYGDPDAVYRYSGITNQPRPWLPVLLELKKHVEDATGEVFNSVLLNRYADGSQHQGYHADDEPELGEMPVIASLSFGGTRRFRLKQRQGPIRISCDLEDGSLLVMAGALQRHFLHAILKTRKPVAPRINLTFRKIHDLGASCFV